MLHVKMTTYPSTVGSNTLQARWCSYAEFAIDQFQNVLIHVNHEYKC